MLLIQIVSLNKRPLSSMEDVFKTLNLYNDNEIFKGYAIMKDLTVKCNQIQNYTVFHPKDIKV